MNILQTIKSDLINALKNRDAEKVSVLRLVEAAVKNKEIEKRTLLARTRANNAKTAKDVVELEKLSKLNEEEVMAVLNSEAKKRKEAAEEFKKGDRLDLSAKEEKELEIIQKYLPEQLTDEEIRKEVLKVIAEIKPAGLSDFGKIMGVTAAKLKGRADGKVIAEILKKELALLK